MRIYKFALPTDKGRFTRDMPEIQYSMHVDVVDGKPYFWAVVDPDKSHVYTLHCFWTGDELPENGLLLRIGTAVMDNGQYVCHYYRETKK